MTQRPYKFRPCKYHAGWNVYGHPCDHRDRDGNVCGWSPEPQPQIESPKPKPHLSLVKSHEREADVSDTTTLESPSRVEVESEPEAPACAATISLNGGPEIPFGSIDRETGEFVPPGSLAQPTLDDTIFPPVERRQVPMVKIGFTGSVDMTQAEWEAYCDQGLEPGRVVNVTLTGFLPDPHARWVKRTEKQEDGTKDTWWEQEGAIKIKPLELGSFELRGFHSGE